MKNERNSHNPEDQVIYFLTLNNPNFSAASKLIKDYELESRIQEIATKAISQIKDDRPVYYSYGKKPFMYMRPSDQIREFVRAFNSKLYRIKDTSNKKSNRNHMNNQDTS